MRTLVVGGCSSEREANEELMMTSTILVTGSTGNVGSQVVKQLAAIGAKVRGAVHSTSKANALKDLGVEPVELDFNKPETIQAALAGVEKIYFLTPLVPNMVEIAASFVEAAKQAQVKHIVRQSALGATAHVNITLSKWQHEVENIIEKSGIPFTFLRPNSFMQNYANALGRMIKTESAFYLPLENAKVSLVDIRDIAAVAVAVLTQKGHEGKAYEITGSEAISNEQIAEIISSVVGRKINYVSISEEEACQNFRKAKGLTEPVEALIELYGFQRAGYGSVVSPVVEQITGKKPISFDQFARDYAEAFR